MNSVLYLTCGYPSIKMTKNILLEHNEYDYIMLNIPFSDPICENNIIQKESFNALSKGITVKDIFDMLTHIKDKNENNIIFRSYANIIYHFGIEAFMKKCHEVNIYGILLVDVPYEEQTEFEIEANKYNINMINVISDSSELRINNIISHSQKLVYIQSHQENKVCEIINYLKDNTSLSYISDMNMKYIMQSIF